MILEGIVTTRGLDGKTNVAPMGPVVDDNMDYLLLRPFQSSVTFRNLAATREGVFHITDDVDLIARAAIDSLERLPELTNCDQVSCPRLCDCCRWYAFRVEAIDDERDRAEMRAVVVQRGRVRDFLGFNRAKHSVLEAAIVATRLNVLPFEEVASEFARLQRIVEKTAGPQESRAFSLLANYVEANSSACGERS